jgi:hypothetical protein
MGEWHGSSFSASMSPTKKDGKKINTLINLPINQWAVEAVRQPASREISSLINK